MKKLIILLLLSFACNAQPKYAFVTAGFDVRNAVEGSKPTNNSPAFDGQLKIGATYHNFEVLVVYENFNKIDFQQFGFAANYITYPLYRIDLAFGAEYQMIMRGSHSFLSYGGNLELRYDLSNRWNIGLQGNYKHRPDIEYLYNTGKQEFRFSTFFNIRYKLN